MSAGLGRSLLCAVLLLQAGAARANDKTPEATWGFELRGGQYRPVWGNGDITKSEPGMDANGAPTTVTTVIGNERDYFNAYFGSRRPLMFALEIERYIPTPFFGLLGPFVRAGQWKATGKSRVCKDASGRATDCTTEAILKGPTTDGNTTTTLTVYPLAFGVVYRFDVLKKKWEIPLIVYGKGAFDYYLWSISADGKTTTFSNGDKAKGGTAGWEAAAGLSLNLDWIDPRGGNKSAVFLDSNLFVEYARSWFGGMGQKHKADMSDTQLVFGLSFNFQ
ncbi:MAG: hypothetical protein HY903_17295 [Deltaproteobacteria bacterium]|nr:hypothetical protein [Deltaproteobacteria bacterium]